MDLDVTARHSPYLAVLVAMHVATAAGMLVYFRRDWVRMLGALSPR
jgi:undecaprenyl-diphosphatase